MRDDELDRLLHGYVPAGDRAVAHALTEFRSLGAGPVPAASAELAAFLADPPTCVIELAAEPEPTRAPARRRGLMRLLAAGGLAVSQLGLGAKVALAATLIAAGTGVAVSTPVGGLFRPAHTVQAPESGQPAQDGGGAPGSAPVDGGATGTPATPDGSVPAPTTSGSPSDGPTAASGARRAAAPGKHAGDKPGRGEDDREDDDREDDVQDGDRDGDDDRDDDGGDDRSDDPVDDSRTGGESAGGDDSETDSDDGDTDSANSGTSGSAVSDDDASDDD